jgi:shikimate kinase
MPHNESPDLTCAAIATIAKRHHVATSRDTLQECLRNLITEDGEYVVGLGGQKAIEKTREEVLRDAAVFVENVEVSPLG